MSLRRRLAQLLVLRASGYGLDHQRRYPRWELSNSELRRWLSEGVGGVILLGGSAADLALRCRQLQEWASEPLLLCADVEEGVGQRFDGASWLPPPLSLGRLWQREPSKAEELAKAYGLCTAKEARALGLNWVLGPVCDVNNNPANPVINVRAWGETAQAASTLSCCFLEGLQSEGVLGCAKHFPGHGDTASDSHLELPLIPHDLERLERIELPPFQAAITAGCASVMTAHLLMPAIDAERPATLSKAVLTNLLRKRLGFDGLVVTDALVMEAIADRYGPGEAAALAFEAGADLILMPADAAAALDALEAGFASGRWPIERLEESLRRREQALEVSQSSPSQGTNALKQLAELQGAHHRLQQELLQASLEHQGGQLSADGGVNLIRVDNSLQCPALPLNAPALIRPRAAGWSTWRIDDHSPPWELPEQKVLLQLFVRGNPFRAGANSEENWTGRVQQLLERGRLAGLVVYGSPYLWQQLQALLPAELPAAYSPGQMPAAQALALAHLGLKDHPHEGGFTD